MRGFKSPFRIVVTVKELEELKGWLRRHSIPQNLCMRARIILLTADGMTISGIARQIGIARKTARKWIKRFCENRLDGLYDKERSGRPPVFSPVVAMELVRLACEMPDKVGRSLCLWDCAELARELVRRGVVDTISPQTVQRILRSHKLKPWRHHPWLRPKAPRDQEFIQRTKDICDIYTRPLEPHEMVLSMDEKTSLQPRTRLAPTRPAKPGQPVFVEHEYERKGALNLFAAMDIRKGKVYGKTYKRKRQKEFIDFLGYLDCSIDKTITIIHIVCDNLKVHSGKEVQKWLLKYPRFQFHFTPVHCSWMNQIEQWFSILQRKRFKITNFKDLQELAQKIELFIEQWNSIAKPFRWSKKSFKKILDKANEYFKIAA